MKYRDILGEGANFIKYSPELAAAIGIEKALIVARVQYWIDRYREKESDGEKDTLHFRDGRYWVFNTIGEWARQVAPIPETSMKRYLSELIKDGILLSRCDMNKDFRDRTRWFSINEERIVELVETMQYAKLA